MSVVLSEHLPLLASAPDGIQKLRGLILELAVRGKLVPQDPNDEPASELLKRISKERTHLEAEGKIRKAKQLPPLGEDERPFDLPTPWEWSRLGIVSEKLTDGSHNPPPDFGSGLPMFSSQHVQDGWIDTSNPSRYLSAQDFESEDSRTKVSTGDVLLTIVASIGRSAVVTKEHGRFALQRSVAVIKSGLAPEFLSLQLRAPVARSYYDKHGKGTAQKGIYLGKLGEMPVAVPALAEQHRIVAKVDELMALCDRLEAEQAGADAAHARLVATLLGTLTQSSDAADLAANWQRLAEHFDTLFTTEASLEALKQTILQLAVMGKLVPQDPNDERASELLKRIAKERARLEATGKIRKSKLVPPVDEDERLFSLPSGWEWIRFAAVATTRLGKMLDAAKNRGELKPYLRNTNVQWFRFDLEDIKELRLDNEELDELRLETGDLLICEGGEPGRCAIWREDTEEMYFQKALHRARPDGGTLAEYLQIVLRQDAVSGSLERYFTGATIKHFSGEKLAAYAIPLPPVAEQHRIVAKVDELMALVDRLKADLAESRVQQDRLAVTLIESALKAA